MTFADAEKAINISNEFKFDDHTWVAVAEHPEPADAAIDACSNHLDEKFMEDLNSYAYLTDEFIIV